MSDWSILAIILWFCAAIVVMISLGLPTRLKPPRRDRNRRGFPLRLTLWIGATGLVFLSVVSAIIASYG